MPRFPWGPGIVKSLAPLGDDGRHIELDVADWQGAQAGQHIDIRVMEGEEKTVRSYSLSSGPSDSPQISVEKVEGGMMSTMLVDHINVGDELEMRGPIGSKFLYSEEDASSPTVLIGGGSGVAPLRGIWRAAKEFGGQVKLVYSVRTRDKAWFLDEIETEGIDMLLKITRGENATGRITDADLKETIAELDNPNFYLCGPNAFVDFINETLVSIGIESERIKLEKWG